MKTSTVIRVLFLTTCMSIVAPRLLAAEDGARSPTRADREAIHTVIRSQFRAFLADDADGAYSFASPALQSHFLSPEFFLEIFKLAYPAVYRPRAFHFDSLEVAGGQATQKVVILGEGEFALLAVYELQRQSDGRWLISACDLYASGSRVI